MTSPISPDGSPQTDAEDHQAPPPLHPHAGFQALMEAVEHIQNAERRLLAERMRRDEQSAKDYNYRTAQSYAYELHSDQILKQSSKKEEQVKEVVVKGKEKSLFREAREAIETRKSEAMWNSATTTACEVEFDMLTLREPPTLLEMSARVLAKHSDAIKSLNLVPEHLKKKLSDFVSDFGGVDARFMELLIEDAPSEVFARNCVELEEKDLVKILCECDRTTLKVLSLDLCGRGMTEFAITEFLKRSPNGFPMLTKLSLKGAFCLTDNGLALIAKSVPLLQFINLSECSLLTANAMEILSKKFGSTLRGLNIGGCQGIRLSSPAFGRGLNKFRNLNYLSVAGLDDLNSGYGAFAGFFGFRGSHLTALSLASCNQANDGFICAMGKHCPNLEALDISDLVELTDDSLQYIADGCRSLNSVKLTKNRFSDEGVAAFLEVCGGSLNELCLNNVRDVGEYTAIALSKVCRKLRFLDLSWCRKLTGEELRVILRCCSLLRSLKLFGWTQVDGKFREELSRSRVHITGLMMKSVFAHLDDSFPSVDAKFF